MLSFGTESLNELNKKWIQHFWMISSYQIRDAYKILFRYETENVY